jgi:hypothetical protein
MCSIAPRISRTGWITRSEGIRAIPLDRLAERVFTDGFNHDIDIAAKPFLQNRLNTAHIDQAQPGIGPKSDNDIYITPRPRFAPRHRAETPACATPRASRADLSLLSTKMASSRFMPGV